ncbi:hypothetical protein [Psychrobacillus phage Perkons]|nr:hypothetical protein [Psychrobacillus phage Perkons]
MTKLTLTFIGTDDWSRPVFEDENGKFFKDLNCGEGNLDLCTAYGFDGEPNTPISYIEKYQNAEIEVLGMDEEPTPKEKFNYQMLGRLKTDCDYYLGNGNRNKNRLWADNEEEQINEMKKIYNGFSEDKKPEWLTWSDILEYELKMTR